jgi:predicted membrane channel-forming protein YqfA (hemolysin III family)
MTTVVAMFGLVIFALGVIGIVQPDSLMRLVERPWRTSAGLYLAMGLRAVLGLLLIAAAASTRFPTAIAALGVLSLVSAGLIPVLGLARIRRFVDWWLARPPAVIRLWSGVACAFGGFLVYAAA